MQLGPYEILDELGRGAMGVVYRARSPRGDEVAVKVLGRVQGDALARFDRERRLAGSFTAREGFVPLLDAGVAPQGPYLVMPLVTGGTLRDRLKNGPFNVEQTLALGTSLANAIALAHARGIVLIADLGLAKHFASDAPGASQSLSLSRAGSLRGTAGYMAPEQAADARSAGPPADVFALGAILYECLSGRAAFEGESFMDVLAKVVDGGFEPLVGVPGWLAAVIEKALATDPARRFADGAALAEALAGKRAPSRRGFVFGVVVIALVASAWAVRAGLVRAALADARTALVAKDYARARRSADEALALDSSNAAALCIRGDARGAAGDLNGALADTTRAIELDPTDAVAWTARGDVNNALKRRDAALADTTRAIELAPGLARAWREDGIARSHKGDLPGALRDAERAVALDATDSRSWYVRGFVRQALLDHKGAVSDLTRALELEPGFAPIWVSRAASRIELRDLAGAIEDCTKAVSLDPKDGHSWCLRGFAREENEDLAGALVDFDRGLGLDGKYPSDWMNRGVVRFKQEDWDGVIADEDRALAENPSMARAYYFRAGAKVRKEDFEGGAQDLERYVELALDAPDAAQLRERIAVLRARARKKR